MIRMLLLLRSGCWQDMNARTYVSSKTIELEMRRDTFFEVIHTHPQIKNFSVVDDSFILEWDM